MNTADVLEKTNVSNMIRGNPHVEYSVTPTLKFVLNTRPETRHLDTGMDIRGPIIGQKHVQFSKYCRPRHLEKYSWWTPPAEFG